MNSEAEEGQGFLMPFLLTGNSIISLPSRSQKPLLAGMTLDAGSQMGNVNEASCINMHKHITDICERSF